MSSEYSLQDFFRVFVFFAPFFSSLPALIVDVHVFQKTLEDGIKQTVYWCGDAHCLSGWQVQRKYLLDMLQQYSEDLLVLVEDRNAGFDYYQQNRDKNVSVPFGEWPIEKDDLLLGLVEECASTGVVAHNIEHRVPIIFAICAALKKFEIFYDPKYSADSAFRQSFLDVGYPDIPLQNVVSSVDANIHSIANYQDISCVRFYKESFQKLQDHAAYKFIQRHHMQEQYLFNALKTTFNKQGCMDLSRCKQYTKILFSPQIGSHFDQPFLDTEVIHRTYNASQKTIFLITGYLHKPVIASQLENMGYVPIKQFGGTAADSVYKREKIVKDEVDILYTNLPQDINFELFGKAYDHLYERYNPYDYDQISNAMQKDAEEINTTFLSSFLE